MKRATLFAIFILLTFTGFGQRRCATVEVNQLGKSPEQIIQEKQEFENWLIEKRTSVVQQNALQELGDVTVYTIPVVVHVIHNGEPYGDGFNIPDEQIISQIEVLNRDFRRLNLDSVNTPSYFKHLAADIGFEFVLALRDPNGLPTNGITRTNGGRDLWSFTDNIELKALSYWTSADYLNIWIAPIDGYFGWAEYPTSEIIDGVNSEAVNNPLTDGVVIHPRAFGSSEFYPAGDYFNKFDLGRIATHEIGHFFGLRHTWGDGDCSVDDYVDDTPRTSQSYISFSNCPPEDTRLYSCNDEETMFMNYMEYVNDACMNLFTLGQKDRMVVVVNYSPRRASLLTSPALDPPPPIDAAITGIISPGFGICDNNVSTTISVFNAGSATLTELEIAISVDGIEVVSDLISVSIESGSEDTIDLPIFDQDYYGDLTFKASILSANGIQDENPDNDTFTKEIFYNEPTSTLDETFGTWPENWAVRTEAPISNWNTIQAPNLVIDNTAAVLTYYDNPSGAADYLISPTLDLTTYTNPSFLVDYAYAHRGSYSDNLVIAVSLDCGNTFTDSLFHKSGYELATTELPASFTPSGRIDWNTIVLDLSAYAGQEILIAIIGNSEGGNNIYLDNIKIKETGYSDLSLVGLENESGAFYYNLQSIGLIVENKGTSTINSISIDYSEDDINLGTISESGLNLLPGERRIITVNNIFSVGHHELQFNSNVVDANLENNSLNTSSNFLVSAEIIPFRQRFNNNEWINTSNWTITSPGDPIKWEDNNGKVVYYASVNGNKGLHDWLVLPMLDLSEANEASIQFKVAYSYNINKNEVLQVWASSNKGLYFDKLLTTLSGSDLVTNFNGNVQPVDESDWQAVFITLDELIGEEQVIIGFESIDGDGADLYLDDIELFVSDDQVLVDVSDIMAIYPNPVSDLNTYATFNLEEKQNVLIRLLDMTGNVLSNQEFNNVLNQTLPIEISTSRNGMYILQTIGEDFTDTRRILVSK